MQGQLPLKFLKYALFFRAGTRSTGGRNNVYTVRGEGREEREKNEWGELGKKDRETETL